MATIAPIVLEGLVTEEGGLEVQAPLSLPPGPVRITLGSLNQIERLPDPPGPMRASPLFSTCRIPDRRNASRLESRKSGSRNQ